MITSILTPFLLFFSSISFTLHAIKRCCNGVLSRFTFILLSLAMLCFSANTMASKYNIDVRGKTYTFEPLNFKYTVPNDKYIALNEKLINPGSSLFLMRSQPKVYFTIIAEIQENIDSITSLEDFVIANLTSVADDVSVVSSQEHAVNGLIGRFVVIDAVVSKQHFHYGYWLYAHNGFVYQVIAWGSQRDAHLVNKQFKRLYNGFRMIQPNRVGFSSNREPLGTVSNKFLTINADNSPWAKWDDYAESYPNAILGGEVINKSYFNIIPFCHMGNRPHDIAINYALLNQQGIDYPADIEKQIEAKVDGLDSTLYIHNWADKDYNYQGRFVVTKGDTCDFLTAFWTVNDENLADKSLNGLLESIHFKAPKQEQLDPIDVKNSASLFNLAGVYYYNAKNYIDATKFFKIAIQNDKTSPLFTNNLFDSFNRLNDFTGAKQFIESNADQLTLDSDNYSWFGWVYKNLDENQRAIKYYKMAVSQGLRNNEDILMYVDVLIDEQRFSEADEIIAQYATDINNPDIVIKRSEIKRNLKDYEGALNLINTAQKGIPLNTEFVFEKIYIAKDKGDYQAAIGFADSLLDAGHASAGAYYQKGEAQYAMHWYAQAKKSFESALVLAPNNEYVLEYIKEVSAMLGQGESTSIAKEILPVDYPKLMQDQVVNENDFSDFNSYLINKLTAIEFTVGKPLKTTKSRTVKLLTDQAVSQYSTIEIGFDALYESIYFNEVVVLNDKGDIVNQIDRNDFYVTDNNEDDNLNKIVHIPVANLSKGTSIRFTYTKQTLSNVTTFPFTALNHSSGIPVVNSTIYVTGDIDQLTHKAFFTSEVKKKADRLTWTAYFPVVYYDQPMSTNPRDYLAAVVINAKNTNWQDLGDDYLSQIDTQLVVSEKVKNLAFELTKNSPTREGKIKNIIDYLQQNITYKAIEFGIRGRMPNRGEKTIELRYGDCKDHAVLLADLLNAININANIVLANLSTEVLPLYPSLDQFNHMIVYLPDTQGGIYIDATDKDMDLIGKAPAGLAAENVLILKPQASNIKQIENYRPEDNLIMNNRNVQIDNQKRVLVTEHLEMRGYLGSQMRHYFKNISPGERFNWAKSFLSQRNRDVNLLSIDIEHLTDNSFPISIKTRYQLSNSHLENGDVLFKDPAIWEYYYLLPNAVVERKVDFQITFPVIYKSTVNIHFTDNYTASNVIADIQHDDRHFLTSKLEVVTNKNTITKYFEWVDKPGSFDKSEYKNYRDSIEKSIQQLTQFITFKKVEPVSEKR